MTRPTVDPALEERLDALIGEGFDARDASDVAGAIAKWTAAWELLPEPKLQWDYYGQALTLDLAKACIEADDLAQAATWVERLDEAYRPHNDNTRMLVDFEKAKLFHKAGQPDLAYAYFDAIYKVKGKKVFDATTPDHYEFYRSHTPTTPSQPASTEAGWAAKVPAPSGGMARAELDDAAHERVTALIEEGDGFMEVDAPQAAAEKYVAALEALPQPYTQWEHALIAYVALADACLALTQYAEAEQAARFALQAPDGQRNGYVWLRLGDALRGQGRDADALEAYTGAYMLEGEELFDGEDAALAELDAAGIRKR